MLNRKISVTPKGSNVDSFLGKNPHKTYVVAMCLNLFPGTVRPALALLWLFYMQGELPVICLRLNRMRDIELFSYGAVDAFKGSGLVAFSRLKSIVVGIVSCPDDSAGVRD